MYETRKYTKTFDIGLSNYQLLKTKWGGEARQELYSRVAIVRTGSETLSLLGIIPCFACRAITSPNSHIKKIEGGGRIEC